MKLLEQKQNKKTQNFIAMNRVIVFY